MKKTSAAGKSENENPFGDYNDDRPNFDTVESYASIVLGLTPGNMQEFAKYKQQLPDELIRYAIDLSGEANATAWRYVREILNRYITEGIKTVEQAKASEKKRQQAVVRTPPIQRSAQQESDDFWGRVPHY